MRESEQGIAHFLVLPSRRRVSHCVSNHLDPSLPVRESEQGIAHFLVLPSRRRVSHCVSNHLDPSLPDMWESEQGIAHFLVLPSRRRVSHCVSNHLDPSLPDMWERVSRESRTSLCYLLDDGYRIASVITWIHRFLTCERE